MPAEFGLGSICDGCFPLVCLFLANNTVRWSRNMAREADGHWNTLSKVTFTAVETLLSKASIIDITRGDTLSVNSWDCFVYCWCTCSPDKSHLWNTEGLSVHWEGIDELEAEKVSHRSVCWAELVSCAQGMRWIWILAAHPDCGSQAPVCQRALAPLEPGMSLNSPGTVVVIFRWGYFSSGWLKKPKVARWDNLSL